MKFDKQLTTSLAYRLGYARGLLRWVRDETAYLKEKDDFPPRLRELIDQFLAKEDEFDRQDRERFKEGR